MKRKGAKKLIWNSGTQENEKTRREERDGQDETQRYSGIAKGLEKKIRNRSSNSKTPQLEGATKGF
jgi:hypothetical protein